MRPSYREYLDRIRAAVGGLRLREYGHVQELGQSMPLLCFELDGDMDREVVITSGFHGEEPAGPLTLMEKLGELERYARDRGTALRIYPCINPSGFERATRYNASGEKPNNDFLRYQIPGGGVLGELPPGQEIEGFTVFRQSPKETRALMEDLELHGVPRAALDIHQDNYLPGHFTYAYVFGPREPFRRLAQASAAHVQIAAHILVDETNKTDDAGLVEFHDGSVTDYFFRRGSRFTTALETTTTTPLPLCHEVNLLWAKGFIDLAANS